MKIIDSHAHIFQYLGGRCGFASEQEHLDEIQKGMHNHLVMPVRRKKDHKIIKEETLWDPNDQSILGKYKVNFRVSRYGRFEWTKDGVDYYIHYMPPTLQNQESSPEFLKIMMEFVGIDKAVLQCANAYGKFNNYYLSILKEYPDVFIPLYRPDEKNSYTKTEIKKLRTYTNFGFKGIWFSGSRSCFDPKYKPFWNEIQRLQLPVFWAIHPNDYNTLSKNLLEWAEEYRDIINVVTQSFPLSLYIKNGRIEIPDFMKQFTKKDNVYFELAYPISEGGKEDYSYPETRRAIKYLYNIFGGEKFVWGSDVPNVERFCTYAQSLNYLKDYCDFISKEDMALILGGNLMRIFKKKGEENG